MKDQFSDQQRKLIETGITEIADGTERGESVNDAFYRYCKSASLERPLCELLGTVYNNGIASAQRGRDGGALEKLAYTETIDIPAICDKLFGKGFTPKTAASRIGYVDPMYHRAPDEKTLGCDLSKTARSKTDRSKTAGSREFPKPIPRLTPRPELPHSIEYQRYQVMKQATQKLTLVLDQLRRCEGFRDAAVTCYHNYLKQGNYIPAVVRHGIRKLFGNRGELFIEPYQELTGKEAAEIPLFSGNREVRPDANQAPYKFLRIALESNVKIAALCRDRTRIWDEYDSELCRLEGTFPAGKDADILKLFVHLRRRRVPLLL